MTSPEPKQSRNKPRKMRADALVVEQGLADTKSKAQALILAGKVYRGEERIDKPGTSLSTDTTLRVTEQDRYVSRGGHKLEGALNALQLDPADLICVDVGASTGGFTDCLLQRGAKKVYAIDVGQGLLARSLVTDPRVVVRDKTNARHSSAADFDEAIDLLVADASFIGVDKLTAAFARVLPQGAQLLVMIKPQFEVGRKVANDAKGVIRDPLVRAEAIANASQAIELSGFELLGGCDSVLAGPKGNVEYFVHARRLGS